MVQEDSLQLLQPIIASPEVTSALIGLLGVVLGVGATLLVGFLTPRREAAYRVREKIAEKQIDAYEAILSLVKDLRETVIPNGAAGMHERIPRLLESEASWDGWRPRFAELVGNHYHWLDPQLRKELMYVQSFLNYVNEKIVFASSPSPPSPTVVVVRTDFIQIAARLERMAIRFLQRQAHRFNLLLPKTKEVVTEQDYTPWLEKTELFRHCEREGTSQ